MSAPVRVAVVFAPFPEIGALARRLEWLAAAGLSEVTVCLSFGAKALRERLAEASRGLALRFFVEPTPLGTAGCLSALGAASLPEDVLVLECEDVPRFEGRRLLAFHASHDALATLAVHRCRHERNCRPVVLGPDRRVLELPPRPLVGGYPLGLSEASVVRRPLLRLASGRRPRDLAADVFPRALAAGETLMGFPA